MNILHSKSNENCNNMVKALTKQSIFKSKTILHRPNLELPIILENENLASSKETRQFEIKKWKKMDSINNHSP